MTLWGLGIKFLGIISVNKNLFHAFFLLQLFSIACSMDRSSDLGMIALPRVVQNAFYGSAEPSTVELAGDRRCPRPYDLNEARTDNGVVEYEATEPSAVSVVSQDGVSVTGISPVVAAAASSTASGSRAATVSVSPIAAGAGVSAERIPTLYEQFRSIPNPQERLERFRRLLQVYNIACQVLPETIARRESDQAREAGRVDFNRMVANDATLESLAALAFTSYLVAHKDQYFHPQDHQKVERLLDFQAELIERAEAGHDASGHHRFALAVSKDLQALRK